MNEAGNSNGPPLAASNDSRIIPNFLGIGPGRSASSWLYHILREHPEVGLSEAKETFYFDQEFHRGTEWYLRFFGHCEGARAIGEVSNSYISNADVAERIYSFNPSMKLISCLRNPIDRAVSHYLFLLRNGKYDRSFENAMTEIPKIITSGMHFSNLSPYLELFESDQVLLILFDDLRKDSRAVVQEIYGFLGVDTTFVPPSIGEIVLPASRPRSKGVARLAKHVAVKARSLGYPGLVQRVKESSIIRLLYEPYEENQYPKINDNTRDQLREIYSNDIIKLSQLVNKNLEDIWLC
jgi:hypothetical protein